MLVLRFFALVLCFVLGSCSRHHGKTPPTTSCSDPLQCFLEKLVIPLPDFEADGISFSEMYLEGITLTSIPSSYIPATTLGFGVENLGGEIVGRYKVGILKGDMSAVVSNANYKVDMLFSKSESNGYEVPSGISYVPNTCHVQGMQIAVTLNIGLPHPAVDTALEVIIKNLLCTTLGEILADQVTNGIQQVVDPALLAVMASQPDAPVPYESKYVSWGETLIGKIHGLLSRFSSSELMSCVESRHPKIKSPYLANLVDALVDAVTHGTGIFNIDFDRYPSAETRFVLPIGNGSLSILSASIYGIDTFTDMHILEPSPDSKVSLSTSFVLSNLNVNLTMLKSYSSAYNETIEISIALRDLAFSTDMAVLAQASMFKDLYLDQLSLDCLVPMIESFSLTSLLLDVDVANIKLVESVGEAGTLEGDIATLGNNVFSLLIDGFGSFSSDMLQGIVQGPLRHAINAHLSSELLAKQKIPACPQHVDPYANKPVSPIIDWSTSKVLAKLNHFINDVVGAEGVNSFVNCATNNTGALSFELHNLIFKGESLPSIFVDLVGLNSFSKLSLFVPVSDVELHSSIAVGHCEEDICSNPLGIKIEIERQSVQSLGHARRILSSLREMSFEDIFSVLLSSQPQTSSESRSISSGAFQPKGLDLFFSNLGISLSTAIQLDMETLLNFNFGQLETTGCELSSVQRLDVMQLLLSTTHVDSIDSSTGLAQDVTEKTTNIFSALSTQGMNIVNKLFNKMVVAAPKICATGGVPSPSSSGASSIDADTASQNWEWEIGLLVTVSLLVLFGFMYSHKQFQRLATQPAKSPLINSVHEGELSVESREVVNWNNSILCNQSIPRIVRIGMPLCILTTMGFILASNLDPNAVTVMAGLRIGKHVIPPVQVFTFTLSGTVKDMWNAKVYPLSILIAFFSGCWPYVKLVVMLASWVIPVGLISKECRDWMLQFLDAYGKYSLMDFYVMILMLCSFHFNMYLGGSNSDSLAEVDLTVDPGFGFNAFLGATLASLVLGHIVLAFHRYDVDPEESKAIQNAEDRERLSKHAFSIESCTVKRLGLDSVNVEDYEVDSSAVQSGSTTIAPVRSIKLGQFSFVMTSRGYWSLAFAYLLILSLICASVYVISFSFDFEGLAGYILGSAATVEYSVISVGNAISTSSNTPNAFDTRFMQACYFIFSIAMPVMLVLVFGWLWLGPALSLPQLKAMSVLAEVFNAWNAIDTFCIAILAALLEISQFAAFIVGSSCDGIDAKLKEYDVNNILHGDDLCFDVQTHLYPACGMLFTAAILLLLISIPSVKFCEHALKDRISFSKQSMLISTHASVPKEEEVYIKIPFDARKFGRNARKTKGNLPLGASLLSVESASPKDPPVNCLVSAYRFVSDGIFRLLWNWELITVNVVHNSIETKSEST